jgi:hypothetical protein
MILCFMAATGGWFLHKFLSGLPAVRQIDGLSTCWDDTRQAWIIKNPEHS